MSERDTDITLNGNQAPYVGHCTLRLYAIVFLLSAYVSTYFTRYFKILKTFVAQKSECGPVLFRAWREGNFGHIRVILWYLGLIYASNTACLVTTSTHDNLGFYCDICFILFIMMIFFFFFFFLGGGGGGCLFPKDFSTRSEQNFFRHSLYLFIYLGFYVAFNTVQVISRRVVGRAEETST